VISRPTLRRSPELAELSSRTFGAWSREFSHSKACKRHALDSESDPGDAPPMGGHRSEVQPRSAWGDPCATPCWKPVNGRRYAALRDGHAVQDADRFPFMRARRAAAAGDASSAGTAAPVPKYISSGVCPRNAECGSTWLCSWT
jgi:hypothetical protein